MKSRHCVRRLLGFVLAAGLSLSTLGVDVFASGVSGSGPTPDSHHSPTEQMSGDGCSWPISVPVGALLPARPAWCSELTTGPSTFVEGSNSWSDEWEHGLAMADVGDGYRTFTFGSVYRTATFRHMDHWMQDIAGAGPSGEGPPWSVGGVSMRPDRSFQFIDGKLVIEADVAAGVADYGGNAWPEITVTTASAPTGIVPDSLYHYGHFGGHWSLGIRLQPSREPIMAIYPPSGPRRVELSFFQWAGAEVYGGEPGPLGGERDQAWRTCQGTDPDTACRDRFRWEIERNQLTLYVNGVKYLQHSNLPEQVAVPEALIESPVYIYFVGMVYKPSGETIRFHWDRLVINPESGPAAPSAVFHSHEIDS